jgi:hypothetical protein
VCIGVEEERRGGSRERRRGGEAIESWGLGDAMLAYLYGWPPLALTGDYLLYIQTTVYNNYVQL